MEQNPQAARTMASAARAQWLSELAAALDEAHRMTGLLGSCSAGSTDAIVLRTRILAVRAEVEALRRGRPAAFAPSRPGPGRAATM
jgi:hypothetical protein